MKCQPMTERRQLAMDMRLSGMSFHKIGAALGVSHQRAQQLTAPSKDLISVIRKRANGQCETCAKPVSGVRAPIHHRAAKGMTIETYNTEENLIQLCIQCHRAAHVDPAKVEQRRKRTPEEKQANAVLRGIRSGSTRIGVTPEEYMAHREAGERWCSSHRAWVPATDFPRSASSRDGLAGKCHECNRRHARDQYASGYNKRWVEQNREKFNAYQKEYHRKKRQQRAALKAAS